MTVPSSRRPCRGVKAALGLVLPIVAMCRNYQQAVILHCNNARAMMLRRSNNGTTSMVPRWDALLVAAIVSGGSL
jgi:hypothetical protein